MILENDNETLKQQVRDYWNAHPCGTQFTDLELGSKEFFEEVERFRYKVHPFLGRVIRFDQYKGKQLLEIGCGLGTDLLQFARGGAIVTGIDLSTSSIDLMIRRFALYNIPVNARTADAENLPFPENSYDLVYSFGVLHHTPNARKAIDEVYRVLRPGGEIIIMLYHKMSLHGLVGAPLYGIYRILKPSPNHAIQRSTTEDWIRLYDGAENPLGKAYTKRQVRRLFQKFQDVQIQVCDPIRRRFPKVVNWVNQRLFASRLGFYLIIKGRK